MALDWKALFSSVGRIDRPAYWRVVGGLFLFQILARLTITALGDDPIVLVIVPFVIVAAVIGINNNIKRLHDLGRSGWWLLAFVGAMVAGGGLAAILSGAAPIVAALVVVALVIATLAFAIAMGALPGQPTANRYGPPAAMSAPDSPSA